LFILIFYTYRVGHDATHPYVILSPQSLKDKGGCMNPNPDHSQNARAERTPLPPTPQPATVKPVIAPVSPSQPTSPQGLAIATLIIGVIAFLTGFLGIGVLLGVVAIILGAISLGRHHNGKAMAIIGIVLGVIAIVVGGFIFLLLLGASSLRQHSLETDLQNQQLQDSQSQSEIQSDIPTE
jgi:hypothetical protein